MFGFTKQITAVVASIFVVGLFLAAPAGAVTGPTFQPGGNGPDPEDPLVFVPVDVLPLLPSASVAANCNSETGTVTVKNPTNNAYALKVSVDGVTIETNIVGPNNLYKKSFPLAENATKAVKVTRANITMLDTDVTRDCLKPAPAYEVLTNCDTEQAHARLINNGDDTAMMAIQYGEGSYAHQAVVAHSSKDWLLTVDPGASVSFHVVHSSTIVGSETLDFSCPIDEPTPEPKPEPTPEPKPEPTPEPKPEPTPEPKPEPAPEPKPEPTPESKPQPVPTTPETNVGNEIDGVPVGGISDPNSSDLPLDAIDGVEDVVNATEVLGTVEELALADITEIGAIGEIVGEVAGPTLSSTEAEGGMSFTKMALIGIWLLVLVAAGVVGVLVTRRRVQNS